MKYYLIFIIVLTSVCRLFGQSSPVLIGQQIPDDLNLEMNDQSIPVKLSKFKGKLLILDFWATWCSPCVAMMPKTDSLQKQFSGKVEILPVTYQDKKTVEVFTKHMRESKNLQFHSVINDKILNGIFPHSSIPFYVWIDQSGKVVATTEAKEVNANNIQEALNSNFIPINSISGHVNREVDIYKPAFVDGIAYLNAEKDSSTITEAIDIHNIIYRSIIAKYIPSLTSQMSWDSVFFSARNSALINIYRLYFGLTYNKNPYLFWSKSRTSIEIKDPVLLNKVTSDSEGAKFEHWLETNGYNYELIWRGAKTWKEKKALLKRDIDANFTIPFGISADLEKREIPSDVLMLKDSSRLKQSTGGKAFEEHDAFFYKQQNLPLSRFVGLLSSYFWQLSNKAIFDETRFKGLVDLELNCNMNDFDAVNKALAKYGLRFEEGNRPTDVLVIKEAKK
jgi:thiol-disulfide isomerase/thioredoxin